MYVQRVRTGGFMRKSKIVCRYDDKTGMTILRGSVGYCIVAAVVTNAMLAKRATANAISGIMMASGFFIVLDLFVRITHYLVRRKNEKIINEMDNVRFVSMTEKITYWTLKILIPVYLVVLLVSAILLDL